MPFEYTLIRRCALPYPLRERPLLENKKNINLGIPICHDMGYDAAVFYGKAHSPSLVTINETNTCELYCAIKNRARYSG